MAKKIIIVLLAALLVLGLAGCIKKQTATEYNLVFVDSDGNEVSSMKVSNRQITLPEPSGVEGMSFDGWYFEENAPATRLDEEYFVLHPATEDTRVYAHYVSAPEFTVMPSSHNGCAITGIIGTMTDVVIPEMAVIEVGGVEKEYVVEEIYDNAFSGNTDIETVFIPSTVKKIGDYAFRGCTNLREITVPSTVSAQKSASGAYVNIGRGIFEGTDSLARITAPVWIVAFAESENLVDVTLNAGEEIADGMFKDAKRLESIVLCDELVKIGEGAFMGAAALKEINIPAHVSEIAADAFAMCGSLRSITVDLSNGTYKSNQANCIVERESETLIAGCANTNIYFGIKRIGQYAFVGCDDLVSLHIPATVIDVCEGAFLGCSSLCEITVADGQKKYQAINDCLIYSSSMRLVQGCRSSVITEEMASTVTSISKYAFAGCIGLGEIYIPSSVATLDASAFDGCTSLHTVVVGNDALTLDGDVFRGCDGIRSITVPISLLDYFIEGFGGKLQSVTLTTGERIDEGRFAGCSSLTRVTLPATVAEIGAYAFSSCKSLKEVTLAEGSVLCVIGHNAFDGDSSLLRIGFLDDGMDEGESARQSTLFVMPGTVLEIGDHAFRGCGIEELAFVNNGALSRIGYKVFADCLKLRALTVADSVEEVDFDAFAGCESLVEAHLPADFVRSLWNARGADTYPALEVLEITSGDRIDCYYIREMKSLRELIISTEVDYIDNRSFEGCSKLSVIELDESNTRYRSEGNCLIEVVGEENILILGTTQSVIPASVTSISSYAFAGSSIASIVIPSGVVRVQEYAFSDCRALSELVIESASTKIDRDAFSGSDRIERATLPANAVAYVSKASLVSVQINSGTQIDADAFKDCVNLRTLVVCADVTSVGEGAFAGCVGITSVTAPASVLYELPTLSVEELRINNADVRITRELIDRFKDARVLYLVESDAEYEIDADAFESLLSLEEASVPAFALSKIPTQSIRRLTVNSGNALVGNTVFPALEELSLGKTISQVDAKIFSQSAKLARIDVDGENGSFTVVDNCLILGTRVVLGALGAVLPVDITEIGAYAFAGREALEEITLHEGITSIGEGAFDGCAALRVESFPTTLTDIGAYAFRGAHSLEVLLLPESLACIGTMAFADCDAVGEIRLPAGLLAENVGERVFEGCDGVTRAAVPVLAIGLVPRGKLQELEIIAGESLPEGALSGFDALTTLTVGPSVGAISPRVIGGTNRLQSITVSEENGYYRSVGNCIISLDGILVMGCSRSVIPDDGSVVGIADYAFYNCAELVSVVIAASVEDFSPLAFVGCDAIESITVKQGNAVYWSEGNSVLKTTDDGVTLVFGCKDSIIGADVSVIGDYAFFGAVGLSKLQIPASVKKIGSYAFADSGLREISLPAGVEVIGESAFRDCTALSEVVVQKNGALLSIASGAFVGCTGLERIVLPVSVVSVAEDAFVSFASGISVYWGGKTAEAWQSVDSAVRAAVKNATVVYFNEDGVSGCWDYEVANPEKVFIWD